MQDNERKHAMQLKTKFTDNTGCKLADPLEHHSVKRSSNIRDYLCNLNSVLMTYAPNIKINVNTKIVCDSLDVEVTFD